MSLHDDIRAGNREWVDGMKSRDAAAMARAYAAGAINVMPNGQCLIGHDAIETYFAKRLETMGDVVDGHVTSANIVEDGDLAYEWGTAEVTFADGKSFGGKFVTVWHHDADGRWRIIRNLAL